MSSSESPIQTIIYCKARGMPFDHVDENAILSFCESNDGKIHGAELECSHAVCRGQGPKFRYCGFCSSAVSKRNFRKRHAHGVQFSNSQIKLTPETFTSPFDNGFSYNSKRARDDTDINAQYLRVNSSTSSDILIHSSRARIFAAPSPILSLDSIHHRSHIPYENHHTQSIKGIDDIPEDWSNLYLKRPRAGDSDGIKRWLSSALSIAGLSTHIAESNPKDMDSTINWFRDVPIYDPPTLKNDFIQGSRPSSVDRIVSSPAGASQYMPKYKMFADSLSLHIETDSIGLGQLCDILPPLDSDSSILKI